VAGAVLLPKPYDLSQMGRALAQVRASG
jgi:hypothetical protein